MKRIAIFAVFIFFTGFTFAQKSSILLTVGNKKVTADEFMHIYKKNNSDEMNKQSVDDYLELYQKFKLKVTEAENLKMDTSISFIDELNGYRDQLAKPYLVENIKIDELVNEAYERDQTEIKLDIIFVKLSPDASTEDTLKAYNKAVEIRKEVLGGENFDSIAVKSSDDRMAKQNKGHLAFLPVLRIPYPIQNYAFSKDKNTLSMPIRTEYGYYLIRVVDTRPMQGFVKVAHIMLSSNDQMSEEEKNMKKEKIDSIYNRILAGDKFEDLLVYSDDKGTAKKGGELPEFSTGRMVPEFETASFALKNPGDISKPVKTSFGWHIIKLIERKPPKSEEEQKQKIKQAIERDPERMEMVKEFVTDQLKNEFNFKQINGSDVLYSLIDSTIYKGIWTLDKNSVEDKTLFSLGKKNFTIYQFAEYAENNQKKKERGSIQVIADGLYENYVYKCLTDTEKKMLEEKKPEFKYIMQEYHDGMLLFDLMKKEIWDKASEDTTGLKKFYEDNKENYQNQLELNISVFAYNNDETSEKVLNLLRNDRTNYPDSTLINKIDDSKGNVLKLVESGMFSEGQSIYADKLFSLINSGSFSEDQKIMEFKNDKLIIYINSKRKSKAKEFNEIKGIVIADYQNYLEDKWMEKLKQKYPIIVNNKVLKKLKKSLE